MCLCITAQVQIQIHRHELPGNRWCSAARRRTRSWRWQRPGGSCTTSCGATLPTGTSRCVTINELGLSQLNYPGRRIVCSFHPSHAFGHIRATSRKVCNTPEQYGHAHASEGCHSHAWVSRQPAQLHLVASSLPPCHTHHAMHTDPPCMNRPGGQGAAVWRRPGGRRADEASAGVRVQRGAAAGAPLHALHHGGAVAGAAAHRWEGLCVLCKAPDSDSSGGGGGGSGGSSSSSSSSSRLLP